VNNRVFGFCGYALKSITEKFMYILPEGVCMVGTNIALNAPYGEIHIAGTPGGRVRFLPITC
jgi:hypothetical protein